MYLNFSIDDKTHQILKVEAAKRNISLRIYLKDILEREAKKYLKENKTNETIRVDEIKDEQMQRMR